MHLLTKILSEIWDRFILRFFSPSIDPILSLKFHAPIYPFAKIDIKGEGVNINQGTKIGNSILQTYGGKDKIQIGSDSIIYDKCELFTHQDTIITMGNNVFWRDGRLL